MTKIQIIGNKINVNDDEMSYTFDCLTLSTYSSDVRDYEIEYIFADITNNYLTVIVTVASGQAGILAVVDVTMDEVVHIQNGSFAVAAIVADKKVISFHDVVSYGQAPFYTIDVMDLGNMNMEAETKSKKVYYESDFYMGNKLSMFVDAATLKISNGTITHSEDISELL